MQTDLSKTPRKYHYRFFLPILRHPLIKQISSKAEILEKQFRVTNTFRPLVKELLADPVLTNIYTC